MAAEAESQTFTSHVGSGDDPFASQREEDNNPFAADDGKNVGDSPTSPVNRDRRMSKEWDASKVPPSRFQKREGSIYSTPGSRDGHVKGKDRDSEYHAKLKEKGWFK